MEFLQSVIDVFLHLDQHLLEIIQTYGTWTYAILFAVIFCETGLVITPFLPGDSLLFAAGALAGAGAMRIEIIYPLLALASICGDSLNYTIGRKLGDRILKSNSKILKRKYVDKTQQFYDKYGAKTMVVARFVPIVRTFAPFMAGVGKMPVRKFALYIVIGAGLWVSSFVWIGYIFGQHPFVKEHFSLVALAIVAISVIPIAFEFVRHRFGKKTAEKES
ncbi:MAG: DedA family protein [bacterium]|nr:DedA family protein [bacterium]